MVQITWTTLPTYTDGNALTGAQLEAIAANIEESAPAKATTEGYWFIAGSSGNSINQRAILTARVDTQQTRSSTSYGALATVGPVVTITTGSQALVSINCQLFNSAAGTCWSSYKITGATTVSSSDTWACEGNGTDGNRQGIMNLHAVTAGSNVFTQEYRVGSGTGTFDDRNTIVMAM